MTDDEIIDFFVSRGKRTTPKRTRRIIKVDVPTERNKNNRGGNAYRFTKTGIREDLKKCKVNVRSGWEADVLRVLEAYDIPFQYEPFIFNFPLQQRSTRFYIPDIYLPKSKTASDHWVEIKGRLDAHSKTKLVRFKRYFPTEFAKLVMIIKDSKECREFCQQYEVPMVILFKDMKRLFADKIVNWESWYV